MINNCSLFKGKRRLTLSNYFGHDQFLVLLLPTTHFFDPG